MLVLRPLKVSSFIFVCNEIEKDNKISELESELETLKVKISELEDQTTMQKSLLERNSIEFQNELQRYQDKLHQEKKYSKSLKNKHQGELSI